MDWALWDRMKIVHSSSLPLCHPCRTSGIMSQPGGSLTDTNVGNTFLHTWLPQHVPAHLACTAHPPTSSHTWLTWHIPWCPCTPGSHSTSPSTADSAGTPNPWSSLLSFLKKHCFYFTPFTTKFAVILIFVRRTEKLTVCDFTKVNYLESSGTMT